MEPVSAEDVPEDKKQPARPSKRPRLSSSRDACDADDEDKAHEPNRSSAYDCESDMHVSLQQLRRGKTQEDDVDDVRDATYMSEQGDDKAQDLVTSAEAQRIQRSIFGGSETLRSIYNHGEIAVPSWDRGPTSAAMLPPHVLDRNPLYRSNAGLSDIRGYDQVLGSIRRDPALTESMLHRNPAVGRPTLLSHFDMLRRRENEILQLSRAQEHIAAAEYASRSTLPVLSSEGQVEGRLRLIEAVAQQRHSGAQPYPSSSLLYPQNQWRASNAASFIPRGDLGLATLGEAIYNRPRHDRFSNAAASVPLSLTLTQNDASGVRPNFLATAPQYPPLPVASSALGRAAAGWPPPTSNLAETRALLDLSMREGINASSYNHDGLERGNINLSIQRGRREYSAHRTLSPARRAAHTNEERTNQRTSQKVSAQALASINKIPLCTEGPLPKYNERNVVSLAIDEDRSWLSALLCFVRSDLVEVFRASQDDVASRMFSKKISHKQIGIRCRYCAHVPHHARGNRSSTYPSSIDRIYQSLTMMIREHFSKCQHIPDLIKEEFLALKNAKSSQGLAGSKGYWIDSARQMGMVDTPRGIMLDARLDGYAAPAGDGSANAAVERDSSGAIGLDSRRGL